MSEQTSNPWDSATTNQSAPADASQATSGSSDPWGRRMPRLPASQPPVLLPAAAMPGASSGASHDAAASGDWLNSAPAPQVEHFNLLDPFHKTLIPLDSWVTTAIDWIVSHFRPCSRAFACRWIISLAPFSSCCWACRHRWRLPFLP